MTRALEPVGGMASFRDPLGRLAPVEGRIFRTVAQSSLPDLRDFLSSAPAQQFLAERSLAGTSFDVPDAPQILRSPGFEIVEHEAIAFPSYPYEWAPSMLHAAASLTVRIARRVLEAGFGLKDANPYNVLFRGPNPVFIDLLSFERRNAGDPTWLPHAQFLRMFLLPLLAFQESGTDPRAVLLASRDGIEPKDIYRTLSIPGRLRPRNISLVSGPVWLDAGAKSAAGVYQPRVLADTEKARFILDSLLRGLERHLGALRPGKAADSRWTAYAGDNSYSPEQARLKREFVVESLAFAAPRRVLDVGCNTGEFSVEAARAGASVVSIDYDSAVVERLWRRASQERLDILPLAVNLAYPTPATGWRNAECPSFLQRARKMDFDCVLMLAVLHHLLVSERVPLDEVLALAADIAPRYLVIEFVGQEDPMFRAIARGREELHRDLTVERFEEACRRRFEIIRSLALPGSVRSLYLLRRLQ